MNTRAGRRLIEYIEQTGLTTSQFAAWIDVGSSDLSKMRKGEKLVTYKVYQGTCAKMRLPAGEREGFWRDIDQDKLDRKVLRHQKIVGLEEIAEGLPIMHGHLLGGRPSDTKQEANYRGNQLSLHLEKYHGKADIERATPLAGMYLSGDLQAEIDIRPPAEIVGLLGHEYLARLEENDNRRIWNMMREQYSEYPEISGFGLKGLQARILKISGQRKEAADLFKTQLESGSLNNYIRAYHHCDLCVIYALPEEERNLEEARKNALDAIDDLRMSARERCIIFCGLALAYLDLYSSNPRLRSQYLDHAHTNLNRAEKHSGELGLNELNLLNRAQLQFAIRNPDATPDGIVWAAQIVKDHTEGQYLREYGYLINNLETGWKLYPVLRDPLVVEFVHTIKPM